MTRKIISIYIECTLYLNIYYEIDLTIDIVVISVVILTLKMTNEEMVHLMASCNRSS